MSHHVRGRVWKQGRTWHHEVSVDGRVVLADNTGAFTPVITECVRDVYAARRIANAGHPFQYTWAELVERAA